jgi:inhibitor of KinA
VASENAVIVYGNTPLSGQLSNSLSALASNLQQQLGNALIDTVQSYNSLLVIYDCLLLDYEAVVQMIDATSNTLEEVQNQGKLIELPVYYGDECGPDFKRLCQQKSLSPSDLIKLHSAQDYCVYAIGFAPGFAFLGEVSPILAAPRLASPRKLVAKGSVGIADRQTAVYPSNSPGGWNLIGNCPTTFFNAQKTPPLLFSIGDSVRFCPIERAEFIKLGGEL